MSADEKISASDVVMNVAVGSLTEKNVPLDLVLTELAAEIEALRRRITRLEGERDEVFRG